MDNNALLAAFASVEQQQQELIAAIFPQNDATTENLDNFDQRGLAIYRNNLLATAQQALTVSFPTVGQLIGDDLFAFACRQLLISCPPKEGDWGVWGKDFSSLLADLPALAEYPFVADIAQLDWLRHHCMRAKNSVVDQQSLQLLASTSLDELYLEFSSSQFLMTSKYPVIEFWLAHQSAAATARADTLAEQYLEQALAKLTENDFVQRVLVYRPNFKAQVRELSTTEYDWLRQINQGISVGHALDNMADSDFDFAQWLGQALEHNLIRCFKI